MHAFLLDDYKLTVASCSTPAVFKRLFTPSLLGANSVTPSAGFGNIPSSCGISAMAARTSRGSYQRWIARVRCREVT